MDTRASQSEKIMQLRVRVHVPFPLAADAELAVFFPEALPPPLELSFSAFAAFSAFGLLVFFSVFEDGGG